VDSNNQTFIESLIFDPSFRRWVEFASPDDTLRWTKFIADHTDQAESIRYAIAAVKALQFSNAELSEQTIENEVQKIVSKIRRDEYLSEDDGNNVVKMKRNFTWLKLAGVIVIGIIIGLTFYLYNNSNKPISNTTIASVAGKNFDEEYINNGDTVKTIILSDQSKVLLYGKSKLSCKVFAKESKREVYLSGCAYFKISKDASKPFIVYTNKLTTKVLGTSFIINSLPNKDNNVSVEVKTGRVSVFKTQDFKEENKKPYELSGLIITPNQKVIYSEQKDAFQRTLTDNPSVVSNPENHNSFNFKEEPLNKVFEQLQKTYGINIVYDKEINSSCSLTASMDKESFYGKLDMISKVMNGSYEIIDGNVIYSSKGCKINQ